MPFNLPEFYNEYFQAIVACGSIQTRSKKILDHLEKTKTSFAARYKTRDGKDNWLLAMMGGGEDKKHFHLEAITDYLAKKRKYNEANISIIELQKIISPMIGRKIAVMTSGLFLLPVKELPKNSIIRPVFFKKKRGDFQIKATGMEFEMDGTAVPNLTWRVIENGKTLRIELLTSLDGEIDEDYLTTLASLTDSAFRAYVLGKSPDDHDD